MKYYIIAGEPSGDLHGSNLMRAIKEQDNKAKFAFWGGDQMLKVDDNMVTHIRDTSIMGFVEVVKNLSKIKSFFKKAKSTIIDFQPDVIVFIDYPGFNLRMAKWAKNKGFKVVYYISPQLWAWKKGRINTIKKYVDEMIVILPFELDFYKKNGVNVHYVGHPLVTVIQSFMDENKRDQSKSKKQRIMAILPGSRKQELRSILPLMVASAIHFNDQYKICVAMAPNIEKSYYLELIEGNEEKIELIENDTYGLLLRSDIALVTSGTATLETALFGVPQVVCYKTNSINYEIGKRLVDLEFISLVNLIAGKKVIPELIQNDVNEDKIIEGLKAVQANSIAIKKEYDLLRNALSSNDAPSCKTANIVVATAKR